MKRISILPGDGIGPEVMDEALKVLTHLDKILELNLIFTFGDVGGVAIDKHGEALPQETLKLCEQSDAILFGSVGGPQWESLPPDRQPERAALLKLRKHFGLFANLRPAKGLPELCPLDPKKTSPHFDILCVRELTGGIYFGEKGTCEKNGEKGYFDTLIYYESEIQRIAHLAFSLARQRGKKVTSIDKANVLSSMKFWRETVNKVAKDFPDIDYQDLYVDNASMQLILNPSQFDVLLCPNMFGDILSDECASLCGSLGLLPSASLGENNFGLYEPAGGTAPDIAGKDIANPIAQILSSALLLRHSLKEEKAAELIEKAIKLVLDDGFRTKDLQSKESQKVIGTKRMGDEIVKKLETLCKK